MSQPETRSGVRNLVKQHEGDCCPLCLERASDEDSWPLCCHLSELGETEIKRLREAKDRMEALDV